jgi:hypothetical protein
VGPIYGPSQVTDAFASTSAADVRLFGPAGSAIPYEPATEPLDALIGRLPAGWRPDALVWSGPEYTVIPDGLETCPFPTVGLCGDWAINAWAILPLLPAFDLVLTDRGGVEALTRLGLRHVRHWRSYTWNPALHRVLPGIPRDIDLLFVGNATVNLYPDRERWLHRLARLADRHRVAIATGVWGEAYTRLLNRARIVFNRSMRGELNQRAYETAAAGALLFMERENLEVRDLLEDRVHCVLYGEEDFETLADHYLAHEDERAGVAGAGRARVERLGHDHHVRGLVAVLASERLPSPPARPFAATSPSERALRRGLKAIFCPEPRMGSARDALRFLERVDDPALAGPLLGSAASIFAMAADLAAPADRPGLLARAQDLVAQAAARDPANALHRLRQGELVALGEDWPAAAEHFRAAAELAGAATAPPPDSLPYPFAYDRFRFFWDRAAVQGPVAFAATAQRLVRARALHRLGACRQAAGEPEAGAAFAESVEAWPSLDGNRVALARWLEGQGRDREALRVYQEHRAEHPMDLEVLARLGELLVRAGTADECRRLERETKCIVRALSAVGGEG